MNNKCISNDDLSLTKSAYLDMEIFAIYLNDMYIGNISISLDNNNVSYYILRQFRNQGYATKALTLLIKLFQNKEYVNIKEVLLTTKKDDIYSQKVILNNGGILISKANNLNTYVIKIR